MLISKIAAKRRNHIKKQIYNAAVKRMEREPERCLSIRQTCRLLNVDENSVRLSRGMDLDEYFTSICAWDFYMIPGSLYAALPIYGNLSPEQAMTKGAKVLLTDHQEDEYPCIVVPNVMEAYCILCGAIRSRFSTKTIAVTGSVGKTTTKDMIRAVCAQQMNVFCDVENNNMATLVGSIVQRIPNKCDCYIQEVHEGDPGSAESISRIIHPDIAIVTNIGESHLGNFGSYEGLVKGVTDITAGMTEQGVVVIDEDDILSKNAPWDRKVIRVSRNNLNADYHSENIQTTCKGLSFDIVYGDNRTQVEINMFGVHNVTDAMLVFAAGIEAGIAIKKIVAGLKTYHPKGMRQNIVHSGKRTLYIDCFNAAVKSMKSALDTLCSLPILNGAKRIAVLGDMAELGKDSELLHRQVGGYVADCNVDILICYGPFSAYMADEARQNKKLKVLHALTPLELNRLVRNNVGKKDVVLFKASHSTNLAMTIRANYPVTYFRTIFLDMVRRSIERSAVIK